MGEGRAHSRPFSIVIEKVLTTRERVRPARISKGTRDGLLKRSRPQATLLHLPSPALGPVAYTPRPIAGLLRQALRDGRMASLLRFRRARPGVMVALPRGSRLQWGAFPAGTRHQSSSTNLSLIPLSFSFAGPFERGYRPLTSRLSHETIEQGEVLRAKMDGPEIARVRIV